MITGFMKLPMVAMALVAAAFSLSADARHALQRGSDPFANAPIQYAPDRSADLLDVNVTLDVDYDKRIVRGQVFNKFAWIRSGLTAVHLHAATGIKISNVTLNGKTAAFRRDGRNVYVTTPAGTKGQEFTVGLTYSVENAKGGGFGSDGGWHWIEPNKEQTDRVGFWTQGETEFNSNWVPTWDYPNDLATSTTTTTIPGDWIVIGNGVLTADSKANGRRTMTWKMNQPHATYLISLAGGLLDYKKDKWRGKELWYVTPKGQGNLIDDSFGDTKDMLTFFSDRLGVEYPWPKYAQNAMYDFGGGMENVSSTTLGAGSLTEKREGYRNMASLNSHELGHQWFGDLVNCLTWGDAWLNESFATYLQILYFEHSRGATGYDREVRGAMQGYFSESRRYQRPIATNRYPNGDSMFDSHSYPKGGSVLHTLRKQLGDEAFFAGLKLYLTRHRHQPVESYQLCRAMTDASGVNCQPFWDQWFTKPGHPVLDYTWKQNGANVELRVQQIQKTENGTPIYKIPAKVMVIDANGPRTEKINLSQADETFIFPGASTSAVVLDPDQEFLREIPNLRWASTELLPIFLTSNNDTTVTQAFTLLMQGNPTPEVIKAVSDRFASDTRLFPIVARITALGDKADPSLRGFWLKQLEHQNMDRRADAAAALGKLPADATTQAALVKHVNATEGISVVVNAINSLANLDAKAYKSTFEEAAKIADRRGRIKRAATDALKKTQ